MTSDVPTAIATETVVIMLPSGVRRSFFIP
jgi:hypothetical protein